MAGERSTCQHCERPIVNKGAVWIDPNATGDDIVWRETCDAHDTFVADHEPRVMAGERTILISVRTICDATVEENWILRVTPEEAEAAIASPEEALDLLSDGEAFVSVSDSVSEERDRDIVQVRKA